MRTKKTNKEAAMAHSNGKVELRKLELHKDTLKNLSSPKGGSR